MTSKLEEKLENCISRKEYYEAHQIYRTLYYRMLSSKKYTPLLNLLFDGSCKLMTVNEYQSAADLSDLFIDVLSKSNTAPSEIVFTRLEKLLELHLQAEKSAPQTESDTKRFCQGRDKFISDALRWSQLHAVKPREKKNGLSILHQKIGQLLWKYDDCEAARVHLLVSENTELFADFLIKIHEKYGAPEEHDLFVALAVLQLLCLRRAKTAWNVFSFYTKNHPVGYGELPCSYPLINFLWLLLLAVPKRKSMTFCDLVLKYEPSLNRDSAYRPLIDKIGQVFFNVPSPSGGGLLGNMLKGLLGGDKKSEEESFTSSDVEFEPNDVAMDGEEDGYTTADEEENQNPQPSSSKPSAHVVDQMDDLD